MILQDTINTIREAHEALGRALRDANRYTGSDPDIGALQHNLQEAGVSLKEIENQALRIQSRLDQSVSGAA